MSKGNILLGVLAGAAVGALLGVLFAPDKGSETRKKISKKGEDYADAIKDKFDSFVDNMAEKFDTAKEDVKNLASNGRVHAEEFKKDVKKSIG